MTQLPHHRVVRSSRRDFLKTSAITGAGAWGFWVAGRGAWADDATQPTAANEKVNLGIIGVNNRAKGNLNEEDNAVASQNIVAICDVDENYLREAADRFPKATKYTDYRKLLERTDLDAVVVSTADHNHAPATLLALNGGRHVYCEKPLTHTVEEARKVAEATARNKRVTQMGTQIHAGDNYRRVVELVQSGAIGMVHEVHVWVGTQWSAKSLPPAAQVPATFKYDLWLGPTKEQPYRDGYHPASWRRYWAFGNGTLGDMACHYMDLPFWALKLTSPTKIAAEGSAAADADCCPPWLIVNYEFPARGEQPACKLTWYDGGKQPPAAAEWGVPKDAHSGVVFIGDKGMLFADYTRHKLLPEKEFTDFKAPPITIPKSIGHHREWLAAVRKNDPAATTCRFAYSAPLTEAVLLGNVAYRSGKVIEWDAATLKAINAPDADRFIRGEYRAGWGLG